MGSKDGINRIVNYQGYLEKYWGYPGPVLKPTSKPLPDQSTSHMKANPSFAVHLPMQPLRREVYSLL